MLNFNKKIVHVILRNKIIGIDSILPLCMEMHGKCGCTFNFISLDSSTYKYIMKDNVVLIDAINYIGKIDLVSTSKYKSKYISKLSFILYFIKVIFKVTVRDNYIMHSGHLHLKPLAWIRFLFKRSNVIFVERESYISEARFIHSDMNIFYAGRMTYDEISESSIDIHSNPPLLYANTLIGYDKEWVYFKHAKANKLKKIVLKDIRKNKYWIEFLYKNADKYIKNETPYGDFESSNILVFIATRVTRTSDRDLINEFAGALKALSKYMHIFPLFIKLHTFSDIEFINELLDISLGRENRDRYVITSIHPTILSSKSIVSVFASEGTLMREFSGLNIPVVDLQMHEEFLPSYFFDNSIGLSASDLAERYKLRKISSDYIFTNNESFDKFMDKTIDNSHNFSDTNHDFFATHKKISHSDGLCSFFV